MSNAVVKKFYRDFTDEEQEFLKDITDFRDEEVIIPTYVVERMVERRILPTGLPIYGDNGDVDEEKLYYLNTHPSYLEVVKTLIEGKPYEISNEGFGKSSNPFRLVLGRESEDGATYFVKIAPSLDGDSYIRILDVWKRKGKTPLYPPPHDLNKFVFDWDFIDAMQSFFEERQESSNPVERKTLIGVLDDRKRPSDKNENKNLVLT